MPRLWDIISVEARELLKSLMPLGWDPDKPYVDIETLEEIDKLIREKPQGELADILSGRIKVL